MQIRLMLAWLALVVTATAAGADPVFGLYKTQPGDDGNYGHVELYDCGGEICGVIRKAFNESGAEIESANIGKRMIWEMRPLSDGRYGKGKIWAPDRDKTYRSKMQLSGAILKVSGCILGICRAQTWTKLN